MKMYIRKLKKKKNVFSSRGFVNLKGKVHIDNFIVNKIFTCSIKTT